MENTLRLVYRELKSALPYMYTKIPSHIPKRSKIGVNGATVQLLLSGGLVFSRFEMIQPAVCWLFTHKTFRTTVEVCAIKHVHTRLSALCVSVALDPAR